MDKHIPVLQLETIMDEIHGSDKNEFETGICLSGYNI